MGIRPWFLLQPYIESSLKSDSIDICGIIISFLQAQLVSAFKKNLIKTGSTGSTITNGRGPRSCLGRAFNSKLGRIATLSSKCMVCMQLLLKLKTHTRARPVSFHDPKFHSKKFFIFQKTHAGAVLTSLHFHLKGLFTRPISRHVFTLIQLIQ